MLLLLNSVAVFHGVLPELYHTVVYMSLFAVLSAAGMKHLRDNDVVHRDIKPGNIMRYITDDGRYCIIRFNGSFTEIVLQQLTKYEKGS